MKKIFLIILILLFFVSGSVFASSVLTSSEFKYTPVSGSIITSNSIQGALDELYSKANNTSSEKDLNTYFDIVNPTVTSTKDYTTLNKNVFLAMNNNEKFSCIIRNGYLHCFASNDVVLEKEHMERVFSDVTCTSREHQDVALTCEGTDFFVL